MKKIRRLLLVLVMGISVALTNVSHARANDQNQVNTDLYVEWNETFKPDLILSVKGKFIDKTTGQPVLVNGNEVTIETTTRTFGDGSVQGINFHSVDKNMLSKILAEHDVMLEIHVFDDETELFAGVKELGVKGLGIIYLDAEPTDKYDGDKIIDLNGKNALINYKVKLAGLVVGEKYKITFSVYAPFNTPEEEEIFSLDYEFIAQDRVEEHNIELDVPTNVSLDKKIGVVGASLYKNDEVVYSGMQSYPGSSIIRFEKGSNDYQNEESTINNEVDNAKANSNSEQPKEVLSTESKVDANKTKDVVETSDNTIMFALMTVSSLAGLLFIKRKKA